MHLTILTIGWRGDVQPYVALGLGLQRAGFTLRLATHEPFRDFVTAHGLEFAPVEGNPQEIVQSEAGQRWLSTGSNPLTFMRQMRDMALGITERAVQDILAACADTDALLFSAIGFIPGVHVAEKLGLPMLSVYLWPMNPTRAFGTITMPAVPAWLPGQGALHLLTHDLNMRLSWSLFGEPLNQVRADLLGLPPIPQPWHRSIHLPFPVVYGYSEHVIPRPADWRDNIQIAGYWFLDPAPDWQPDPDLIACLEAGPSPVYVGFGSMPTRDPEQAAAIVLGALRKAGQRGVLLSGWAGLSPSDLPDGVIMVHDVPPSWLFPRMAAVVHHGGAGTTAAGLRAGVPSLALPFFADQPFWGRRVQALGVGPAPIPRKKVEVDNLAYALRRMVTHQPMRDRAAALGALIQAEDGVGNAVRMIQAWAADPPVIDLYA